MSLPVIQYFDICMFLTIILGIVSLVFPFIIELFKKLIGEDKIVEKFGKMENFCFMISVILGLLVYISYMIFGIVGKFTIVPLDIVKLVFIGFWFCLACAMGAQCGWDKVVKLVIEIIGKIFGNKK